MARFKQKELFEQRLKGCPSCGKIKGVEEFPKNKTRKDGLGGQCKLCVKIKFRSYFKTNPGAIKESTKKWEMKNPHKLKAIHKKYRKEHSDKVNSKNKKWRQNNPESFLASMKKYAQNNPEVIQQYRKKRVENLHEGYLNQMVSQEYKIPPSEMSNYSELKEFKKIQIKIKREIENQLSN